MKKILKIILKPASAIFLGIAIALTASYASAFLRSASISTSVTKLVDAGSGNQTKGEPLDSNFGRLWLKSLLVGTIPGGTPADDTPVDFARINEVGSMSVGRPNAGSGIVLDILEKKDGNNNIVIKGTIRALDFKRNTAGKIPLCASLIGVIERCGQSIEFDPIAPSSSDSESGIYSLIIPEGVTALNVYLWGAGGAGYGSANVETFGDDGDSSFFEGANVSLTANGGAGSIISNVAGKGGEAITYITSGGATIYTKANGGDGEIPPSSFNGNPTSVKTGSCGGTTYYVLRGGTGNIGGKGGAPYQGSKVNGGTGGKGGPISSVEYGGGSYWNFLTGDPDSQTYLDCNKKDTTSDNHVPADMKNNRPGGNGVNGATLSAGGSGFGGKGGVSASTDTSTCNNVYPSSELCKGQISSSGGGAGSYIYATVPVSSSQVFYIKAGRGGVPQIKSCTGTGCEKNELGGGAVSGKGGPGKVKVEFIYGN